jgi:flagellar hook-associated protein 1
MTTSIFGIGLSGLAAAQAGLATTGHNIANVNTAGFNRQEAILLARTPQFSGSGFFGQGVDVVTVRRVFNDFLQSQVISGSSQAADLSSYYDKLSSLDLALGSDVTGVQPALQDFFDGINGVASHPSNAADRQSMLSSANSLVSRFHRLDSEMTSMRQSANTEITGTVNEINTYVDQIAGLNRRIMQVSTATTGGPPNDLLDQRDQLVQKLNGLVDARVVQEQDGTYNVFLAGGQALVVNEQATHLVASRSATDPRDLSVGVSVGGAVVPLPPSQLSGGSLGAVLRYRDGALTQAQNELGRVALVLADRFNQQQRAGLDQNGVRGADLFGVPAPAVQPSTRNTGSGTVGATIADATAVAASDYSLEWSGTQYTLTRASDGTQRTFATLPQTVDGLTISIGGTPAAGDTFLIQPTRYAARDIAVTMTDPAKIAAASPLVTGAATANTGSGAISTATIDTSYWATQLATPVTITYSAGPPATLGGFPATQPVTVTVGGVPTTYAAGAPVPYTSGATIGFGGISFTLSGAPANGDAFTLGPSGPGDGRNAQAMVALGDANLVGGSTTFEGALAQLVADVGNRTQAAGIESEAQTQMLDQTIAAQQSLSGVNLDEEAANLTRYQQAYQAAGKMMAIAASLFDTILSIRGS